MIENFTARSFFRNIQRKIVSNNLYRLASRTSIFRGAENELKNLGIIRSVNHGSSSSQPVVPPPPPPPPPLPSLTSSNFPTTSNNNLFSNVFCKNISTNNGFIQKENNGFNNLPNYKTETAVNEGDCLGKCNSDNYCTSYSLLKNKNDSNCLLYNTVPTSLNNNITTNSGYKINNYKYDLNNLNNDQKNIIRKDCLNNYFNNENNTTLDYSKCYNIVNNNSNISFDAQCLANMYEPLNKVKVLNNYNNIDTDLINSITNEDLNNFSQNYEGYLQSQIGILNSLNNDHQRNKYHEEINIKTDIESNNAKNNMLQQKNEQTNDILNIINNNNDDNNNDITESFENYNVKSNNIIKFYLYILFGVIIIYFLFILKKCMAKTKAK